MVLVVPKSKMPHWLVKTWIQMAGVWYQVDVYPKAGPVSRCELYRGCGYIERKYGCMPKWGS